MPGQSVSNTYTLTTGSDTLDLTGTTGNTIVAPPDTLNAGDSIQAGYGDNTLELTGVATFDLTVPQLLTGIDFVAMEADGQTLVLRPGLPASVSGGNNETVTLANTGDSFIGGGDDNTLIATSAILSQAALDGGPGGGNVLRVTDADGVLSLDGGNVTDFTYADLDGSGDTFNPGASGIDVVYANGSLETINLAPAGAAGVFDASGDTALFAGGDNELILNVPASGAGAAASETLVGFDTTDSVVLANFDTTVAPGVSFDSTAGTLTVDGTDAGGASLDDVLQFRGAYANSFALSQNSASQWVITYTGTTPAEAILTTGDDTVTAGTTLVVATDSTLTSGDDIEPTNGATLDLAGGGTFDLTQPATLTNIGTVLVEGANADVTLRQGLVTPVTLSAGASDATITLANTSDSVDLSQATGGTVNASADEAANATITGNGFTQINLSDSARAITFGGNVTNIRYLDLFGGDDSLDPGQTGASVFYLNAVPGQADGNDTVVLGPTLQSAVDYATSQPSLKLNTQANNFFFTPGADDALTLQYAGTQAAENVYGFDATGLINLPDVANGATLTEATDSVGGAPGELLTVTGQDMSGNAISQSIQVFGTFTGGFSIQAVPDGILPGQVITYTGAAPANIFTDGTDTIGPVGDAYAATNTIGGGDTATLTGAGRLHLIGPGDFDLTSGASVTGLKTIVAQDQSQTITLGDQTTTLDIESVGHDEIDNLGTNTTIEGNSSGNNHLQTTSGQVNGLIGDLGSAGQNTLQITDQDYSLTLNNAHLKDLDKISIVNDASVTIDTGTFAARQGGTVEVSIDVGAGTPVPGADKVVLGGKGDVATDFFGGNVIAFDRGGEYLNADMTFQNSAPAETILGFDTTDTIVLPFPTAARIDAVMVGAGQTTLTVGGTESGTAFSQTFLFTGDYALGHFVATPTGSQGFDITYVPCFLEGTRISTPGGDKPVEAIRAGDVVRLDGGGTRPVTWVGSRLVDVARHKDPDAVAPILIAAGAMGPGLPARDLIVSPDHAVMAGGALVPARLLVNGTSVRRLAVPTARYFHVELDAHDVLLAEGLPAESYLECGNRTAFDGGVTALRPDFAADRSRGLKVATDTAMVAPIWRALAARARDGATRAA